MKRTERNAALVRRNAEAVALAKELRESVRAVQAYEIEQAEKRAAVRARYRRAPRLDELDERRPDWDEANLAQKARR